MIAAVSPLSLSRARSVLSALSQVFYKSHNTDFVKTFTCCPGITCKSYLLSGYKLCPRRLVSVVRASALGVKGRGFSSGKGHVPRCRPDPGLEHVGRVREATN